MTRFTDRVERDLSQISDRATPSSTAWEAIRHRIDEQDTTAPTMEVIMLDPDTNRLDRRPRTGLLVAASVAAIALVGGLIVVANRDDDSPPADRPDPTVPVSDPAIAGDPEPAPVVVDPDLPTDPDGAVVPEPEGEVLPPVELPTQGIQSVICTTSNFDENDDGSITGPQNCTYEGDPLPVAASERGRLTIFLSGQNAPDLFVSTGDEGAFTAGYTTRDGSVRYSGFQPGVGDYAGETIHFLGVRADGSEATPGISDWTTDPGDTPLPTTEEGGISAEIAISCSAEFVSGDDTEQVLDQSCTYSSDDPRFDRAPEVIRVRIFPPDPGSTTLAAYPLFVTGNSDDGYAFAGIAEDPTTLRGLGVRPGTGDFDGMLVHDVAHLVTSGDGDLSGTIRSTVYPDA